MSRYANIAISIIWSIKESHDYLAIKYALSEVLGIEPQNIMVICGKTVMSVDFIYKLDTNEPNITKIMTQIFTSASSAINERTINMAYLSPIIGQKLCE